MYSVSLLLLVLSVQTDGLYSLGDRCNYKFKQKYPEDKNNYSTVGYNSSVGFIDYCTEEDVPYVMTFDVWLDDTSDGDDSLKIGFTSPKRECKYGVTLLVNPSIKDERECKEYNFDKADDIKSKIHTAERNMCIFKNTNQSTFARYKSTVLPHEYEDDVWLSFKYIFTGCYALRFHIGKQKYIIREPAFLNTTYQRAEAKEPQVICRYKDIDIRHSNLEKRKVKNFTLDVFVPGYTGYYLNVTLISPRNKDLRQICIWTGEPLIYQWSINLAVPDEFTDKHCNVKLVKPMEEGTHKRVRCNFQIETPTEGHCFLYQLIDERCEQNTIWNPYYAKNKVPCLWIQRCVKSYDHWLHVATVSREMKSDKVLSASSYLLLPIITIVLIVSAIGILYFRYYLCNRKEEVNLYVNPQHDDSDCPKSIDFGIIDNVSEKEIGNPSCDDIVLLYTNNSSSFMTLMKDFRETLAKMCSCSVHDWHNGAVWNEVAKVGAVSWFTELLNNECRVIWIDTPVTRSVVISNSRDNESNLDKLSKYYEIHDFRDMAFRAVLEVAKSKVNDSVARQYRRHFVVRFEGLESTANVNDPFLDLSPHARYYMPQHLMQLCSDLSVVKPEISKYKIKVEEDLYRLFIYQLYKSQTQQRLKFIKMESTI
ncbi:PREDICTED: uncharacterized protein LOC105457985 [Wasmannia auropunctata]|uniref:uncharacterized protein LOC105457985 n=1 Tax=Wasmannia auropunctata TaxID=64793 RepID=UPI0005F0666B|nr:PREDICTED: uncharacterized protein LOC105457985 [Wasmannia auropunctata]